MNFSIFYTAEFRSQIRPIQDTLQPWNFKLDILFSNCSDTCIVDLNGVWDGVYANESIVLTQDFLLFEHTDGLNYFNVEIRRFDPMMSVNFLDMTFGVVEGFGMGFLYPRTSTTLMDFESIDEWHVAGYGVSFMVGVELSFLKHFFFKKYTYIFLVFHLFELFVVFEKFGVVEIYLCTFGVFCIMNFLIFNAFIGLGVFSVPFRSILGAIGYIMLGIAPQLAHAYGQLARFNDCYGKQHWDALLELLGYIRANRDRDIFCIGRGAGNQLSCYTDAM